jgi:hypothetical protein
MSAHNQAAHPLTENEIRKAIEEEEAQLRAYPSNGSSVTNNEKRARARRALVFTGNNKYKNILSYIPPPKRKGWFSRRSRSKKNRSTRKRK